MKKLLLMVMVLGWAGAFGFAGKTPNTPPASKTSGLTPQLPTDLLFGAVSNEIPPAPFNALVQVNAETLETHPFYTDTISIFAVSWSPQGRYLAIIRDTSDYIEVCVLDRSGQLQTCFEEGVSRYAFQNLRDNYKITWSSDEQRIYFIVEQERILSLIEGDIFTGQIIRTIYQSPQVYYEWPPLIHWTPALDYVAIYNTDRSYTSDYENIISIREVTVVNLQTNESLILATQIAEHSYYYVCEGFSPLGNYLTARVYANEALPDPTVNPNLSGMTLIDKEGQVTHAISQAQLDQYDIDWGYCPTWQGQEETFYFLGGSQANLEEYSIFKYVLSTGELTEYKQIDPDAGWGFPVAPLLLSPDGSSLAFRFRDAGIRSEVAALLPGGEIIRFNTPYSRSAHPLWIPAASQ